MASSSSNEQPIDRISSLPDALLLHILSFLDMSQAVQTGILSSRWMGLWTAIPSLDFDQYQYKNYKGYNPFAEHFEAYTGFFDYDDFNRYNEFDDSDDFGFGFGHGFGHDDVDDGDVGGNADDFIKFVEHSLVLHVAPKIHRFSLTFDYSKKFESFLDGWILSAVRRDVKELYLEFPVCIDDICKLPSWLFKCKSLVSLCLHKCPIGVPKSVCFSSLLSLTITWIRMEVGSIPALIAGSPLLEELVLDKCELSSGRLRILPSSPSSELRLKRLTVTLCCNQSGDEIGLELRAPHLEMLNLCGVKPYKNSLRNLISLREAHLDIYCSKVNPKFHPALESWLQDLQHVRLLELSSSCLKVLSFMGEPYRPSYDSKTKCLMLESELESLELRGIANLLWRSHDLENLIIKLSPSLFSAPDLRPDNNFDNGYWGQLKFSFPCVERRLTTVKISGFMGRKFTSAVGRKTLRRFFVKQDKEIELVLSFLGERCQPSYSSKTKCLVLESELQRSELPGIANLLSHSHDLENLIKKFDSWHFPNSDRRPSKNDFDNEYWERLKFSFPCLLHCLMTVKISGFLGRKCRSAGFMVQEDISSVNRDVVSNFFERQDTELEIVRFFLTNAVALKKMTIQFCEKPDFLEGEEWSKILLLVSQKFNAIPRASSCAELSLLYK